MAEKKGRTRTALVKEIADVSKEKPKSSKKSISFLLPSGADLFDLALGGGLPISRIINLVGDAGASKTLLASEMIFAAKKELKGKLEWFFDDAEERYSFNTEKLYGFTMMEKDQENSYTIEDFAKNLKRRLIKLKDGWTLIYVLDSFDALSADAEVKKEKAQEAGKDEKGSYNLDKQKGLGKFFRLRKKDIKNKRCILIINSQVRVNIGLSFGPKYYRTGGKALDHWATVIAWLAEAEKLKKKKRAVGVTVKAKITKVGNDKPFRECFFNILFDMGVDNITSNINYLYSLKTDLGKDKKKEKLVWDEQDFTKPALVKHIEDNDLEDELRQRVVDKWQAVEDSISSKDRKPKWKK